MPSAVRFLSLRLPARAAILCGPLLCLVLPALPSGARASMPAMPEWVQGCVVEGFLLVSPTRSLPLAYPDQVDWRPYEGKTVRYRRAFGRGTDRLLVPPRAIGPCDAAMVAAALPQALAKRAGWSVWRPDQQEAALRDIRRATGLAPGNCEFAALQVFVLERLGRSADARADIARAARMPCAGDFRRHLQVLRETAARRP